jgi:uncharacterized peroxidase-related enzyme
MQRLSAINPESATGKAKTLLDRVQTKLGMVPNLMRTMANSPAVLEAYLTFKEALTGGVLSIRLRERIALTVAEVSGCDYCLAAHSAVGRMVGLSEEGIQDSRKGVSPDSKVEAALRFAQQVVEKRGRVADHSISRLRRAGYGDEEIIEIIANVSLNLFTNYINLAAQTTVDFPAVKELKVV